MAETIQTSPKEPDGPKLDVDLVGILKDTKNLFQNFIKTNRELKGTQLEMKLTKDQLQSAKQRLDSNNNCAAGGAPSADWNRLSRSLSNIVKVVNGRKDIVEYEQTIRSLTEDNEKLKGQLAGLEVERKEALEQQRSELKGQVEQETAQFTKQISELMVQKELITSESSIKYDLLQTRMDRMKQEHEERCSSIVARYEKLLESLTEQKQKLREENFNLQRRELELQDQLDRVQNHSTDFLLGRGRKVTPIGGTSCGGSQRYSEVVETVPFSVVPTGGTSQSSHGKTGSQQTSQRSSGTGSSVKRVEVVDNVSSDYNPSETVEVSSSSSSVRSSRAQGSPQHPGMGGHVTKPRKKRKLFTPSNEGR